MATAHMHPHQSWQMQPGSVHGMSHYHQEHDLPHHQQWAHTPTTSMPNYASSPIALAPYSLVHQSPMQFGQHSQQQPQPQGHHHHHHQHQQQQQHHHHQQQQHHHHQQQQHPHQHAVRPQSSASSLHSALPSALPSPVHPMSHAQGMAPVAQPTHSPITIPALGHNVLPMPLASPQQAARYNQPVPHQVVGQQGIRGVLPKSTGDPSSPEETFEPEQETDGSWPCKFCGKKYRHAKHLRRHHARHTGETPYECTLCQRKFGRSDVLKRHYHKCATRRGVEVGDHLQGQRGHPRRRARGPGADASDLGSPQSTGHPEVRAPAANGAMPMDGMTNPWS